MAQLLESQQIVQCQAGFEKETVGCCQLLISLQKHLGVPLDMKLKRFLAHSMITHQNVAVKLAFGLKLEAKVPVCGWMISLSSTKGAPNFHCIPFPLFGSMIVVKVTIQGLLGGWDMLLPFYINWEAF